MLDQDVKYLKFKTYLNAYCPHCRQSFNVEVKDSRLLVFDAKYKGEEIKLNLSPYLDVFDVETSASMDKGEILEDIHVRSAKKV